MEGLSAGTSEMIYRKAWRLVLERVMAQPGRRWTRSQLRALFREALEAAVDDLMVEVGVEPEEKGKKGRKRA